MLVLTDIKPISVKYSKLSKSLDKVFTGKSVESFAYQMSHPKKITFHSITPHNNQVYSTYIAEDEENEKVAVKPLPDLDRLKTAKNSRLNTVESIEHLETDMNEIRRKQAHKE